MMKDNINLLQEVLARAPFAQENPALAWNEVGLNIAHRDLSVTGRSVKERFYLLLKSHREDDKDKLKR